MIRKYVVVLLGIIVVCGAGLAGYLRYRQQEAPAAQYSWAFVEPGLIRAIISSRGPLSALSTVDVSSQVSGLVTEVNVDFNQRVIRGEVLARIDPGRYGTQREKDAASLKRVQSELRSAQATLALVQADHRRRMDLARQQLISRADLDASAQRLADANSRVSELNAATAEHKAALGSSEFDVRSTVIRSPVDGVVLQRAVEPGQTVAASLQSPTLFKIAEDLAQMKVTLSVDEADVGRVVRGNDVEFTVDARPGRFFSGVVEQVRLSPTSAGNVVFYPVIVSVSNTDRYLVPGMTANAQIEVARRDGVLVIPVAALAFTPKGAVTKATIGTDKRGRMRIGPRVLEQLAASPGQRRLFQEAQTAHSRAITTPSEDIPAELTNFFGPGVQVQLLDEAPGGIEATLRRQELEVATRSFARFRSALNPIQQAVWDDHIRVTADATAGVVFVLKEGRIQPRNILVGPSNDMQAEVIDGLSPGEKVVTDAI